MGRNTSQKGLLLLLTWLLWASGLFMAFQANSCRAEEFALVFDIDETLFISDDLVNRDKDNVKKKFLTQKMI